MNDVTPPPRKRPLGPPQTGQARPSQSMDGMAPRPQMQQSPRQGYSQPNSQPQQPASRVAATPQPLLLEAAPKKAGKKRKWWIFGGILLFLAAACAAAFMWYTAALQPVSGDKTKTRIEIASGTSPGEIGQLLEQKKLIRSALAFDIYTRLSGTRSKLQAGTYNLSPSESTQGIVDHFTSGKIDQFSITFLPGATLAQNRTALIKAGYGEVEVDAALDKTYDHPLFANKPETADLEGYIYGETYSFESTATVEEILKRTFDEYYKVIEQNDLINGFQKQGLNLFQGITLASIIQREVPGATDQKQVAQIFLKRLSMGMQLGSDVTYQYAAKKMGVTPSPALESPYNTRKYAGLPPGPIATPGKTALLAVATPAAGEYVYFLSGDDDKTYYAITNEEHEKNIQDHCKMKCSLP